MLDPFCRDITDRADIPEYLNRITVSLKGLHLEGRIDQRVGTGKGIILAAVSYTHLVPGIMISEIISS